MLSTITKKAISISKIYLAVMVTAFVDMNSYYEPLALLTAIILGSITGLSTKIHADIADYSIVVMLSCLFFNVSMGDLLRGANNKLYLITAWLVNFVALPTMAYIILSIFVDKNSMVFVGLIFYLVAPCTDWFLGFTKLTEGDVDVNCALLPINLLSQILLLPVYLFIFTGNNANIAIDAFFDVLLSWVLYPFVFAQCLRLISTKLKPVFLEKSLVIADRGMLIALSLLLFTIFNNHILALIGNLSILPVTLVVVVSFFISVYLLGTFISKKLGFNRAQTASLIMTLSARNTPLMLAISMGLFPDDTVIPLILILGMLIEFPHLIFLSFLLRPAVIRNQI